MVKDIYSILQEVVNSFLPIASKKERSATRSAPIVLLVIPQ